MKTFRICSICVRKLDLNRYWYKGKHRRAYACKFCYSHKNKQIRMYEKLKKSNKKYILQQCKNKDIVLF